MSKRAWRLAAILAGTIAAIAAANASPARGMDEEGCLLCHGLAGFGHREADAWRSLALDGPGLEMTAHGAVPCRGCHRDVVTIPHGGPRERVSCGLDCHGAGQGGEPVSHAPLYWGYMESVHGTAVKESLPCRGCHPSDLPPGAGADPALRRVSVCQGCHRDSRHVRSWFADAHGRAFLAGDRRVPTCPDCHTLHAVHPAAAEKSSLHRSRRASTCAGGLLDSGERSCHREAATAGLVGMNPPSRGGSRRGMLPGILLALGLAMGMVTGLVRRR